MRASVSQPGHLRWMKEYWIQVVPAARHCPTIMILYTQCSSQYLWVYFRRRTPDCRRDAWCEVGQCRFDHVQIRVFLCQWLFCLKSALRSHEMWRHMRVVAGIAAVGLSSLNREVWTQMEFEEGVVVHVVCLFGCRLRLLGWNAGKRHLQLVAHFSPSVFGLISSASTSRCILALFVVRVWGLHCNVVMLGSLGGGMSSLLLLWSNLCYSSILCEVYVKGHRVQDRVCHRRHRLAQLWNRSLWCQWILVFCTVLGVNVLLHGGWATYIVKTVIVAYVVRSPSGVPTTGRQDEDHRLGTDADVDLQKADWSWTICHAMVGTGNSPVTRIPPRRWTTCCDEVRRMKENVQEEKSSNNVWMPNNAGRDTTCKSCIIEWKWSKIQFCIFLGD